MLSTPVFKAARTRRLAYAAGLICSVACVGLAQAQQEKAKPAKQEKSAQPATESPAKDKQAKDKQGKDKQEKDMKAPARPGLKVGDKAPNATVLDARGRAVKLADLWKDGPVIVTFYRGGWCPFCTKALSQWQDRLDEVKEAGGTFVAITPESPDHTVDTARKHELSYSVYSDNTQDVAKAYKVHFTLDEETRKKYKGYGIDLAASNASGTWELPAPATYVIDREGTIRYVWADWDYKKRADPDEVINALRQIDVVPASGAGGGSEGGPKKGW